LITLQILKRQINSWACLLIFFQKNFLSDKIPISSYQASQIYLKNELICQILRDNLIYPRKAVFEDSKNQEFTQREIFSWKDTWFRRENNFSFEFNYNFIIHPKQPYPSWNIIIRQDPICESNKWSSDGPWFHKFILSYLNVRKNSPFPEALSSVSPRTYYFSAKAATLNSEFKKNLSGKLKVYPILFLQFYFPS